MVSDNMVTCIYKPCNEIIIGTILVVFNRSMEEVKHLLLFQCPHECQRESVQTLKFSL
jgi:hypothetical protein